MFAFGIMNNENMTGIFDGMERCSHTDKKKRQDRNISEEIKSNFVLVTVFRNDSGKLCKRFILW